MQLLERQAKQLLREAGLPVLMKEPALTYQAEYYFSFALDSSRNSTIFVLSAADGKCNLAQAVKVPIDSSLGLRSFMVQKAAFTAGVPAQIVEELKQLTMAVYQLYEEFDAVLIEVNPLVLTHDGKLVILDAKIEVDDHALFRQPVISEFAAKAVDPAERAAREAGLVYVKCDGNVGVIGNGIGLTMAIADMIHDCGGQPAGLLDIGNSGCAEVVEKALHVILADTAVQSILINIYCDITSCDEVAARLLAASTSKQVTIPVVVRMVGANAEIGCEMLADSGWEIVDTLWAAAKRAVTLATQGGQPQ